MTKRLIFSVLLTISLLPLSPAKEKQRPKVGLVLGGGGALGFAHIGVLKELERLHIQIDYIGGTSMGAIVAGMYASGMSPEEIEQRFTSLDWWEVLRDRSSHQYLDYRRKLDDKRFMGMEFGIKGWNVTHSPGMAYGQKLNNVLETFSINSVGITDFDKLNIPYRAIATDLRSGTSVVLDSGNLALTMRASMAVPGAFTPVRMGDMVLVDGGILNNIPVEVVKNMGADIIIAVDVGASAAAKNDNSEFRSLGSIVGRTYSLMQRPDQEKQLALADLVISPQLPGKSASQFHLAKEIIPSGLEAVKKMAPQLSQYSVDATAFQAYLKKQRKKHNEKINITDIQIEGNQAVSDIVIRKRIMSKPGPLELKTVFNDLNRIHGMGDFQTVTYDLIPNDEGYELQYNTTEKFWGPNYLHFGLKLEADSDNGTLWGILLNYTRTQLNPLGGEARFDIELGGRKRFFRGEWYQPISQAERVFFAPSILLLDQDIDFYVDDTDVADIDQQTATAAMDLGISFYERGEFRIGMMAGHVWDSGNSGTIILPEENDAIVAATTHLRLDQLDDPIFPTKGYRLSLDGEFSFSEIGSTETYSTLELKALLPLTFGPHTITPRISMGTSLKTELPFYAWFDVGGLDSFAGYAPYQLFGNYYGVGSLSYRYRIGKLPPMLGNGIFAIARLDAGNAWFDASDARFNNLQYGFLAGLGANTLFGTCTIAVGKAESISPRFYFTIGNTF
jgi:NTE family protein